MIEPRTGDFVQSPYPHPHMRPQIEAAVSVLIDLLDSMDPDPDMETDNEDRCAAEDDAPIATVGMDWAAGDPGDAEDEHDREQCPGEFDSSGHIEGGSVTAAEAVIAEAYSRGYGLIADDEGVFIDYRRRDRQPDDLDFWHRWRAVPIDDIRAALIAERSGGVQ